MFVCTVERGFNLKNVYYTQKCKHNTRIQYDNIDIRYDKLTLEN